MTTIVVVLKFYGPSTHFRSFRARSHCSWASLLGSLPALSAHSFASKWQLPFLNQRERMVVEIFSWPNLNERMFFAGSEDRTRDRPHTRRTRIRSSYRARPCDVYTKNRYHRTCFVMFAPLDKLSQSSRFSIIHENFIFAYICEFICSWILHFKKDLNK